MIFSRNGSLVVRSDSWGAGYADDLAFVFAGSGCSVWEGRDSFWKGSSFADKMVPFAWLGRGF